MDSRNIALVVVVSLWTLLFTVAGFFWIYNQRFGSLHKPSYTPSLVWALRNNNNNNNNNNVLGNVTSTPVATNNTNGSVSLVHQDGAPKQLTVSTLEHSSKLPLCSNQQVINGRWMPTLLENGPPFVINLTTFCYNHSHLNQRPFPSWEWVPFDSTSVVPTSNSNSTACEWTQWNTSLFCELLPAATVLLIGDSLSKEHYMSLAKLLGSREPIPDDIHFHLRKDTFCRKKTRILYQWDNLLQNAARYLLDETTAPPTVLVMNRGAHYTEDEILLNDMVQILDTVESWWRRCQQYELHCHFFYRTTVPGHRRCGSFTEPVNNLTAMEAWVEGKRKPVNRFHWYDYKHQNQLILKELERRSVPFILLDAYHINILRPDGHKAYKKDCLHNCAPGKNEVLSQFMLHELRRLRTKEQAEHHRRIMKNHPEWLDKFGIL